MNILRLELLCTPCRGWPQLRVRLQDSIVHDITVQQELTYLDVILPRDPGDTYIEIERWGKTSDNSVVEQGKIQLDQVVEIRKIFIDGVAVPHWFLWNNCTFRAGSRQQQSLIMVPNGIWRLTFATPIVTHILDQKILHEAQYNQDYQYPWSYKFGPGQVAELAKGLNDAQELVKAKL